MLASLFFSDYRRRVLGLLLLRPGTIYQVRELARLTGTSASTLHKELSKLIKGGVLLRQPEAFAGAINSLAQDAALRARLGRAGRAYAVANLDKEAILARFGKMLQEI